MYYSTIFTNGTGFTNQIISFIYSIIIAINEKHRVIVVDKFLDDNIQSSFTPISHIINLKELNEYLLQKYNIIVVDKYSIATFTERGHNESGSVVNGGLSRETLTEFLWHNVNWKLLSAYYGTTPDCKNDITEEIKDGCLFGDRLFINKYTDFNRIKGDPSYGKEKHFYLTYEISISSSDSSTKTHKVEEIYNEILTNHIAIDISSSEYKFNFINLFHLYGYTNYYNIFDEILSKIHYAKEFENCALATIRKLEPIQTVNVIHLRVEKDAITHWSAVNNMSYGEFKDVIEAKYIALIQKYMDKKDKIILLANFEECMDSSVIDFLIRNDYPVVLSEKFFAYREKNAIVDLLVSRVCNNIFIGCINKQKEGSTFSHYISKMIGAEVMKIGIDIDSIKTPEYVFY